MDEASKAHQIASSTKQQKLIFLSKVPFTADKTEKRFAIPHSLKLFLELLKTFHKYEESEWRFISFIKLTLEIYV